MHIYIYIQFIFLQKPRWLVVSEVCKFWGRSLDNCMLTGSLEISEIYIYIYIHLLIYLFTYLFLWRSNFFGGELFFPF